MYHNHKQIQEHVLERDGCPVHYWLAGPEGAPLVVLTHGATADHRMFDPQLGAVARDYRVLVWDVRGHGRSQPIGSSFSIAQAVEDLLAILDRVGCEKAALVGQSMGAYIAQELVFSHPERVAALAVVGGVCITFKLSRLEQLALRSSPALFRLWPHTSLRRAIGRASSIRPEVQEYIFEAAGQISKVDFSKIWSGVASCIHYEPGYRIEQPVLLTHGEFDGTGNIKKDAPRWAARDPQVRYVVIPEAGHVANMDNPAFFNPLLMGFLQKNPARPG
jgi:pimeloyl-ACP methyl ester carboxylesterase